MRIPSTLVLCITVAACGGNVVFDGAAGGQGGAGGSTSTTSGTTTGTTSGTTTTRGTTTGTGTYCQGLADAYQALLTEASTCNACIDFDECANGPVLTDLCGCPVGVSVSKQDVVEKAKAAYSDWVAAGCGPYACGEPCFVGQFWYCGAVNGGCQGACMPGG